LLQLPIVYGIESLTGAVRALVLQSRMSQGYPRRLQRDGRTDQNVASW
jgi:hypothetical protein